MAVEPAPAVPVAAPEQVTPPPVEPTAPAQTTPPVAPAAQAAPPPVPAPPPAVAPPAQATPPPAPPPPLAPEALAAPPPPVAAPIPVYNPTRADFEATGDESEENEKAGLQSFLIGLGAGVVVAGIIGAAYLLT